MGSVVSRRQAKRGSNSRTDSYPLGESGAAERSGAGGQLRFAEGTLAAQGEFTLNGAGTVQPRVLSILNRMTRIDHSSTETRGEQLSVKGGANEKNAQK